MGHCMKNYIVFAAQVFGDGSSISGKPPESLAVYSSREVVALAAWQRRRLETAYKAGKRSFSVRRAVGTRDVSAARDAPAPIYHAVCHSGCEGELLRKRRTSCMQVKQLAGDTHLSRKEVLQWLKQRSCEPEPDT